MEEQTQTEPEPRILSSDFVDLIKKIAEYVKNEIKTDIITTIDEISTSRLNKDVPLSSEQDISPEKASPLEQTAIVPPHGMNKSLFEEMNMVSDHNVMPQQYKTRAGASQHIVGPAPSKINSNLSAQELFNVQIAEPIFQNEHAKVMTTISQHLWLIEDLLQYPHNDSPSIVHQFFDYIQNCLRIYPVLITIFTEDPSKPAGLLFANRTDKLRELADIIRFNAHWLKSWLPDQFLSETIRLYSENEGQLQKQISSQTNIGEYSKFSTDFHSTRHVEPLVEVSSSPENDSGYTEQSNSDDVIEELLQTLDAVRLRALINQYDRDYDDRLRENVTRILNKPYVAEDITKGQIPATIQLMDSNKRLACRLVHAEDQLNDLQKKMTHFSNSLDMSLSNKKTNTISSTTMTDPNPTNSTINKWFSPF